MALRVSDLNFVTSPSGLLVPEVTDNPSLGSGAADVTFDIAGATTDGYVLTSEAGGAIWAPAESGSGIPETILNAKGDLIAASAADTAARLPAGSDGQILESRASEATGLKWVEASGGFTFTTYTPTLTATVSNPNMGSGATVSGRYAQSGKLVFATIRLVFGSSPSAGSGTYNIALPVTAASAAVTQGIPIGYGWLIGSSRIHTLVEFQDSGKALMRYLTAFASGFGTVVSNSNPWTWIATYTMVLTICYEAA